MGNSIAYWLKQAEEKRTEQTLMTCVPELQDSCFCGCYWWKNRSCWWSFKLKFKVKLHQKQLRYAKVTILMCVYFENTQMIVGSERQMLLQVCQCIAVPLQTDFQNQAFSPSGQVFWSLVSTEALYLLGHLFENQIPWPHKDSLEWIETWPQSQMLNSWKSSFSL